MRTVAKLRVQEALQPSRRPRRDWNPPGARRSRPAAGRPRFDLAFFSYEFVFFSPLSVLCCDPKEGSPFLARRIVEATGLPGPLDEST